MLTFRCAPDAIGNHAADESKEQDRDGRGKAHHAQPECGVGELQHQPALGDVLHPGADVGEEVAGPEEAEVAMAQGAGDAWNLKERGLVGIGRGGIGLDSIGDGAVSNGAVGQAVGGVGAWQSGFIDCWRRCAAIHLRIRTQFG